MSTPTLNSHEARALGVLIEKELTTPDQYPLSLNALVSGCNQKSNRDPVTDYTPAELVVAIQGLTAKHLAGRASGGRVEKFQHSARQSLGLAVEETAVLAELLLRGAQQPGELRSRVKRMAEVGSQAELVAILQRMATKGLVRDQGKSPGERVERWAQLLCAPVAASTAAETPGSSMAAPAPAGEPVGDALEPAPPRAGALEERVAALEARVAKLEATLADLGG